MTFYFKSGDGFDFKNLDSFNFIVSEVASFDIQSMRAQSIIDSLTIHGDFVIDKLTSASSIGSLTIQEVYRFFPDKLVSETLADPITIYGDFVISDIVVGSRMQNVILSTITAVYPVTIDIIATEPDIQLRIVEPSIEIVIENPESDTNST
jgi:hypothetical protein